MPNIYVIGGCNGSGKTTSAFSLLANSLRGIEFINADEIARDLSPSDPESVAIIAGRLMINRLKAIAKEQIDFVFESTLSGRNFVVFLRECKELGYTVNLIYVWLNSPQLAIKRVQRRVESGGHNIPPNVIMRRYERSILNLLRLYLPLADAWIIVDNSGNNPHLIAEQKLNQDAVIYNSVIWQELIQRS